MSLNGDVLKGWLRRMDAIEKGSTRKEQFVHAIQTQLTLHLREVLARLTLEERCFLAECAHQGRFVSAREFEAKYDSHCPMPRYHYGFREEVSLLTPFISIPSCRREDEACLLTEPSSSSAQEPPRILPRGWINCQPAGWRRCQEFCGDCANLAGLTCRFSLIAWPCRMAYSWSALHRSSQIQRRN